MKVAIVHPSLAIKGGAENIVIWLARGLRKRGHSVTVFTTEYNGALWSGEYTEDLEVVLFDAPRRVMNSAWLGLRRVGRVLRKKLAGFDVVNCHNWPSNLWVASARRTWRGFPRTVWCCHEPNRQIHWERTNRHLLEYASRAQDSPYNAHLVEDVARERMSAIGSERRRRRNARAVRWDRASVRKMDTVLVNSRFSRENFEGVYGVSPSVCYLGIPLADKEAQPTKGGYFCVVSALTRKKNVHNVVEAMHILVNEWKLEGLNLRIVGDGPERGVIEDLVAKHGLRRRIEVLGSCSDGELRSLYERARLTVYVPIDEPFGLVPLESMALGTPVISSDHGGPVDTVVHKETGLHVDCSDPRAIAAAVKSLYYDEARIREMGSAGARRVRENFTLESFVDRFETMALGIPRELQARGKGQGPQNELRRLNLGCGRDIREGYVNLDRLKLPGVDLVHDLGQFPYPFAENCFDEIAARDILEHLGDTVRVMEELWRILKPGGILRVRVPHARSMNFLHDPTHVSAFTEETFHYFTPPDPSRTLSKYAYYSAARFEILDLRTEYSALTFLGSMRLSKFLFGREVRLDYGNVHGVLKKVVP